MSLNTTATLFKIKLYSQDRLSGWHSCSIKNSKLEVWFNTSSMGLHSDVKPYLRERFSKSVNDAVPQESCDVSICDHMWILFHFSPKTIQPAKTL